jgi:CyaY protein
MTQMDEPLFDRIAAEELKHLEKLLGDMDPDELEVDFALDVLTLTLAGNEKIVINSHRAARQIWMAAFRKAWHFTPHEEAGRWSWRTEKEELHQALRGLLRQKLGKDVAV